MSFYMPTRLKTGRGCVMAGADIFRKTGARCLIVTGKNGARKSGALGDLVSALDAVGVAYEVYDGIGQNPTYAACLEAAAAARAMRASYIVGVGGGSPLDAAKAVAVLAACSDTSAEALFSGAWDATPLPVIAIGTTAGTGSEVTPVAVITTPEGRKIGIRADTLYPVVAFGDAAYTASLSAAFTRSTALDALSHCLESYFNRTANDISRLYALRGIRILLGMLSRTAEMESEPLSLDERERLYLASLYGGLAISVTGTAFPHALGYFLTESHGIPHGNACAVYLEEFILHNATAAPEDMAGMLTELGIDADGLIALVRQNLPPLGVEVSEGELAALAPRYENNKSLKKCFGVVDSAAAIAIIRRAVT